MEAGKVAHPWTGDLWGGLAAMLVALPAAIAFGVTIFSPLGGGYAAQGLGGALVSRIEGSYSNVVGLHACEVAVALEKLGLRGP